MSVPQPENNPAANSPSSVLVIGGGVSGLITLRNLILHGNFHKVHLVERRSDIGGVWFLESQTPHAPAPLWQSPAYPGLIGNVLPEFLSFSSHAPFPDPPSAPDQPFPSLQETHGYLKAFAEPMLAQGRIRCRTEVLKVEEAVDSGWTVRLRDTYENREIVESWDAVVICTGWHNNPWWPETEGLQLLRSRGFAFHAKDWMGTAFYNLEDKKVLVLGNAASGNDIAAQLADAAPGPGFVYRSIRRPAFPGFPSLPDEKIQDVKPVHKYTAPDEAGKFSAELSDGTIIEDLDLVIAGTGQVYRANPDFIYVRSRAHGSHDKTLHNLMKDPVPDPYRILSLYEHILYAPNVTLAFIGCIMAFTPFTIADLSSAWLALAWSGQLSYPSTLAERLKWEQDRLNDVRQITEHFSRNEEPTNYISYNVLGFGEQAYAERLKGEIEDAGEKGKVVAATLPVWSNERTKERERMYDTKLEALRREKERR